MYTAAACFNVELTVILIAGRVNITTATIWSTVSRSCNFTSPPDSIYRLPGLTNKLISEVIRANPKTIVVNESGTPVEMPWIDEAHTLLQVRLSTGVGHCIELTLHIRLSTAVTKLAMVSRMCYLAS